MSTQIRGGLSTVLAETDAFGDLLVNTPTDPDIAGFAIGASEVDPGTPAASIARTVRQNDTSADYRLRTGQDTPKFYRTFPGTITNTNVVQQSLTSMTVTQSVGFLRLNAGNSVTSGQGAAVFTYTFFSAGNTQPVYFETVTKYAAIALQVGVAVEMGLMCGPSGVADPTDGAFFRYQDSSLLCVISYGGSAFEITSVVNASLVPAVNEVARYQVIRYTDYVEFWINNLLVGRLSQPKANGSSTLSPSQQGAVRIRNTAAVGSAVQVHIYSIGADDGDVSEGQSVGQYAINNGGGSWQTQDGVTPGQTTLWANSAAPAAGTLSNTALPSATYNTQGGLFDFNAPAGAVTDYIAFAYLNPAGTNAVPGKNLYIDSITISVYNDGATVATTPTQCLWSVAVGSTALSLATADSATNRSPKRIPLCNHTLQVGAVAGEGAKEGTFRITFKDGILVEPGTYLHFILRVPTGTATAGQRIKGLISALGSYRLWEPGSSSSATSATPRKVPTRRDGSTHPSPSKALPVRPPLEPSARRSASGRCRTSSSASL